MATPGYVFTISHVAEMLGEDEELLWEIGTDMFPEHGCLWVVGIGEEGVMAFTNAGIDNLREIIASRESMKKK
jgi:hypothetical protein